MNNFKEFNIKPKSLNFVGDKVKIDRVLNTEITILDFKIGNSKVVKNSKYLTLQIERNEIKHIIFTGSTILIQMISQVSKDKFPFKTIIKKDNEHYEFT